MTPNHESVVTDFLSALTDLQIFDSEIKVATEPSGRDKETVLTISFLYPQGAHCVEFNEYFCNAGDALRGLGMTTKLGYTDVLSGDDQGVPFAQMQTPDFIEIALVVVLPDDNGLSFLADLGFKKTHDETKTVYAIE